MRSRSSCWLGLCFVLVLFFGLSGCRGIKQISLGIPASVAPQFFFHVKAVAQAQGMMVSDHDDSVHVRTSDGDWLQYMLRDGGIVLLIIPRTKGLTDEQVEERQDKLRQVSDRLVNAARQQARLSQDFQ